MRIIVPKNYCEIDENYGPLFFLAGPVRGGGDWQKKCCEEIQKKISNFYVAIPYYYNDNEAYPLMKVGLSGDGNIFQRQLDWERYYLELASKKGSIIFWLPEESKTNPRKPEEGPYATDTRGEIARWSVELKYNPACRVVIGAEKDFFGLCQIQRNFSFDQGFEYPFFQTLEETVREAVSKVSQLD